MPALYSNGLVFGCCEALFFCHLVCGEIILGLLVAFVRLLCRLRWKRAGERFCGAGVRAFALCGDAERVMN